MPDDIWWLLLITVSVITGFFYMFRRIVDRYCDRIASLPDEIYIWHTFPARGWALLIFMMGLGIALKHIPGVSSAFTASFYSGLGPMLLVSSTRFLLYMKSWMQLEKFEFLCIDYDLSPGSFSHILVRCTKVLIDSELSGWHLGKIGQFIGITEKFFSFSCHTFATVKLV